MKEQKNRKGLSRTLKLFYGVGDFGFTLMCNVENYFFNFFLTDLAQFPLAIVSLITTVSSVADAALSWIYGAIINSTKPGRWGRYRTWLVLTPWIVPFIYAFQFVKIGNGILPVIIIIAASILSHVLFTFPVVASVSLMTVAGKTAEERAQLSSVRAMWNSFSKIIFSYVGVPLAAIFAGILGETNQYAGVAFCLAAVMVVGFYVHFKMFDGYEEVITEPQKKKDDASRTKGKDLIRSLMKNPSLIFLLLANLSDYIYNFICAGVAVYYFNYVVDRPELLAVYIMISNVTGILGSYFNKVLVKKIESRNIFIGTLFGMALLLIVSFFTGEMVYVVIVLMCLVQFGYGIIYACTPVLYSDTIIYSEWKTGKNATGWISGLQQLPLKLGVVTRGIIISACLAIAGFETGMNVSTVTEGVKQGICTAFMIIPAVFLILGALLMMFGFKLTKEKVARYQEEIRQRRSVEGGN